MDAKEIYLSKPWLKYYPKRVPADAEIPEHSIPEIFEEVTEKYSRKTGAHLLWQEDYIRGIERNGGSICHCFGGFGGKKRRHGGSPSSELPAVRHRLLCGAQAGSGGDAR